MRKAQLWYSDFIIGLIIFLTAVVTFWAYQNSDVFENSTAPRLLLEAVDIGTNLNSPGTPTSWTPSDVVRVGISNGNNRINESKLMQFASLDYGKLKDSMSIENQFSVHFEYLNGSIIALNDSVTVLGTVPSNAKNIVETKRIMILQSEMVKMIIRVWNE